ncbi:MAG: PD-(D/E)XK nuclease family protein, partial [Pseudomonadota bacterium]
EQTLRGWGWASDEHVLQAHYQTIKAFYDALGVFATLDRQMGSVGQERAMSWLREVVDTRQHQPKHDHTAPITILPAEDVAGQIFDHLWVSGLDATRFPGTAHPSPFLPVHVQERHDVPGACPETVLSAALALIGQLRGASQDVVFSYPAKDGSGVELHPSPVVEGWAGVVPAGAPQPILSAPGGDIASFEPSVPAVGVEEVETIRGGVAIVKDACTSPFMAFLIHRLKLKEFPEISVGLDARTQGSLAHRALELFWQNVRTSDALADLDEFGLQSLIGDCVAEAIEDPKIGAMRHGIRLARLEARRLNSLLADWIALEKRRTHPFEVTHTEQRISVSIRGLPLRLVIDRIDRVAVEGEGRASGHSVVMDYKTGSTVVATSLNASNLTEPQLPIYAVFGAEALEGVNYVSGVCLAHVHGDKQAFHTRSDFSDRLVSSSAKGHDVCTPEAWAGEQAAWTQVIEDAVSGFLAGAATFEYSGKVDRRYEYLQSFLRAKDPANEETSATGEAG